MQRNFNRIAFFWVGADVTIPSLLVQSIRRKLGEGMEVVQLSNRDTPVVEGVSSCRKLKLPAEIMTARLEAYSSLSTREPTLYLDADMLVTREFDLPELAEDQVGVTIRDDTTSLINWTHPVEFPEFEGKRFIDAMPYIYAFIYSRTEVIFVRQLVRLRKLPKRYHLWYGDQITLKDELDSGKFRAVDFDVNVYNRTVRSEIEFMEVMQGDRTPCLLHFKGVASKRAMAEAARQLCGGP